MAIDTTSPHSSGARRRHKKKDSALELPDLDQIMNQDEHREQCTENDKPDSILRELIITPLLMISFLLSLLYVDREQRLWRVAQRADSSASLWSKSKLSLWRWIDPQPYQDPSDTTWQHTVASPQSSDIVPTPAWSTRKKHRKIFSMEFQDALKIRGRVMVYMVFWLMTGSVLLFWITKKLFSWYKT